MIFKIFRDVVRVPYCNEKIKDGRLEQACEHLKHQCLNLPGSFECHCRVGWRFEGMNENKALCSRVYACQETPDVCDPNATCQDFELSGTYACHCIEPYHGDGKTCSLPMQ